LFGMAIAVIPDDCSFGSRNVLNNTIPIITKKANSKKYKKRFIIT
jgi:hypothetical protein